MMTIREIKDVIEINKEYFNAVDALLLLYTARTGEVIEISKYVSDDILKTYIIKCMGYISIKEIHNHER